MRLAALLLVLASAWGCNAIFGVDGLRYDAQEGGAGGTATSNGGEAGSPTTVTGGGGVGGVPGAGGAGGGGGGTPQPPCGGPNVLTEDFTAPLDAAVWDILSPARVSIDMGELLAEPPFSPLLFAGVQSEHAVRLTDDYVEVEVIETPQNADLSASLSLRSGDGYAMTIGQRGGELVLELDAPGPNDQTTIDYDPQLHRWWRIEEQSGIVSYRTSPDGDAWTEHWTVPRPIFADFVTVRVGNYRHALGGSGIARFDNLNTRLTTAWCAAETASDAFDDDIGAMWRRRTPGQCTASESGGRAVFELEEDGECRFESSMAYVLEGSHVSAAVTPILASPAETFLRAEDESGAFVEVGVHSDELYLRTGMGGAGATATTAYDAMSAARWRIREEAGIVYLETRADNEPWTELLSAPSAGELTAVAISIGARIQGDPPDVQTAEFDSVNVP